MVSFKKPGGVDTGGFPEKILALTKYDMTILSKVHSSENKMAIERGAVTLIANYFENFVDAKARANSERFHHIYEWDRSGDKNARLFKRNITSTPAGAVISFNFTKSKEPNRNGYIFYNKASVMESGQTVIVRPKNKKFLVYTINDQTIITSKPSIISSPGGTQVKGAFTEEWQSFSTYKAKSILKELRYFERINDSIVKKRKLIIPKINRGMIAGMISEASKDASSIAMKAATNRNV
jgi:hypothetical protein